MSLNQGHFNRSMGAIDYLKYKEDFFILLMLLLMNALEKMWVEVTVVENEGKYISTKNNNYKEIAGGGDGIPKEISI